MAKVRWLDRRLHVLNVYYCLCRTPAQFHKELASLGIEDAESIPFMKNEHSHATTQFLNNPKNNARCALVCLGDTTGRSHQQVHGLLVHEAMHIWREHRELIGEVYPSSEFEAYAMQHIAQELFEAYATQPSPRRKKQ